jgi:hypothetical protein
MPRREWFDVALAAHLVDEHEQSHILRPAYTCQSWRCDEAQ